MRAPRALRRRGPRWWGASCGAVATAVLILTGCADTDQGTKRPSAEATGPVSFAEPTATTSRVPATVPSTPVSAPATLPPEFADLDRTDPDAVAQAVVRLWYSWDTTRDTSTYEAKLRAVPLLEPAVALELRRYPPVAGPGADWLALTAASAVVTVPAHGVRPGVEAGAPPDTATLASRLLEVTQVITTATGALSARHLVVGVVLRHIDGQWWVAQVATR